MDTNSKIADLLKEQTYEERMEMAKWFADVLFDLLADSGVPDQSYMASIFDNWADVEIESSGPSE